MIWSDRIGDCQLSVERVVRGCRARVVYCGALISLLGIYVMVVAGLARRTRGYSSRNGPPLAPSRYRFDLEVSIAWSLARWAPQDLQVGATVRRLRQIAHIAKVPSAHPIATLGSLVFGAMFSRPICIRLTF